MATQTTEQAAESPAAELVIPTWLGRLVTWGLRLLMVAAFACLIVGAGFFVSNGEKLTLESLIWLLIASACYASADLLNRHLRGLLTRLLRGRPRKW